MRKAKQGTKALFTLRDMIITGKLAAGARLVEAGLVERLRISRTPIRAALARLAEEGLLEKTGGGYSVRGFTEQEVRDSIHLRGTLEGLAARTAAERDPPAAALAKARSCIAELDPILKSRTLSQADIERYIAINETFHATLVDMADSFVIRRAIEQACALPFAAPTAFFMGHRDIGDVWRMVFISQEHHRAMLDAIEKSEGARAEAIAREHAELALDAMRLVLEVGFGARRLPGLKLLVGGAG
jgi:GntR family transcriptional regulator of vanillate catabolism